MNHLLFILLLPLTCCAQIVFSNLTVYSSAEPTGANQYFVDFQNGNDASAGTSRATAWLTIPGTRNTNSTSYYPLTHGAITHTAKMPAGSTIWLKPGTTYSGIVNQCGEIWINEYFYDDTNVVVTAYDKFVFKPDLGWGLGPVTFDGAAFNSGLLLYTLIDGVTFDGIVPHGIIVQHSYKHGLQMHERTDGTPVKWLTIKNLMGYNNGRYADAGATDSDKNTRGASIADFSIRKGSNAVIDHVECNGNASWYNGIILGESTRAVTNAVVSNCIVYNHMGTAAAGDDTGIAYKAYNSQATIHDNIAYNELKGIDVGQSGATAFPIIYTIYNNTICSNTYGINFNNYGLGGGYTGTESVSIYNNVLFNNTHRAVYGYAGPFTAVIAHNTIYNTSGGGGIGDGHIQINASSTPDTNTITAFVYNNIFQKADDCAWYSEYFVPNANIVTIDSDFNAYVTNSTGDTTFCNWANSTAGQQATFLYGANGPGQASGNWWTWYGNSTTLPTNGLGHFHCDANSVIMADTAGSAPQFTSLATHVFTLTAPFSGTDISGKAWYVPAMGLDRTGKARTAWTRGAYEYP